MYQTVDVMQRLNHQADSSWIKTSFHHDRTMLRSRNAELGQADRINETRALSQWKVDHLLVQPWGII